MNQQTDFNGNEIEIHRIIARPLYFGLVSNVILPMALLMACYYHDQKVGVENKLGELANPLFYLFIVLAASEGALALWFRGKLLEKPMICRKETFQEDLVSGFLRVCRPVFMIIASISLFGYFYYFLTGRFTEAVFMVLFSFIVFQFVRPRFGTVNKVVEHQYKLAEQGKFYTGGQISE